MQKAHVIRTTTDKLQDELNRLLEAGCPIEKTEFIGGRDWVVVAGLSLEDAWHPTNWEAGKPGILPAWMCGVYPVHKDPDGAKTPCMYQRDHIGRHHFEPYDETLLVVPKDEGRNPNAEEFLRDKLRVWDITLPEVSAVPILELISTWMEEWHVLEIPDSPLN